MLKNRSIYPFFKFQENPPFFHTFVQGPYFILFIYNNCWVGGPLVLQNFELTVHIIGISSPQKLFQFQSYTDL
jgi:hypothetical protein